MREHIFAPYVASTKTTAEARERQRDLDRNYSFAHAIMTQAPLPTEKSDPRYHLMVKHPSKVGVWRDSKRHYPVIPTRGRQFDRIPQNNLLIAQHKSSVRAWGEEKDVCKREQMEKDVELEVGAEGDTLDLSE